MQKFLTFGLVFLGILATPAKSHWGPYHYLTFKADGEVQTIKVKGNRWDCITKHKYNLHWTEKFIKCSK